MRKLKNIKSKTFLKNILVISSATSIAQLLNMLLSPVLTRIYTPDEYGVMTSFIAILGIISIIGSLKYELGIPIAKNDEKAINILFLSIIVLIMTATLTFLLISIFGRSIIDFISNPILYDFMFLIPFGILASGLYSIFYQWALRKKSFNSISKTKVNQSVSQNLVKLGLGVLNFGPLGLILGTIIGQSAGILTLSRPVLKEYKFLIKKISIKKVIWSAKRYIRFPLYTAPSHFLNSLGLQLPLLFMTSFYSTKIVGYYGLAYTIVNLPMSLIGMAVADVYYSEVARIGMTNSKKVKQLSNSLFKKLVLIGILPFVILVLFGPNLFSIVFGEEWYNAGVYARIISLLVLGRFIFTPISRIFSIYEKQSHELILDIIRVFMLTIVCIITYIYNLNSYLFVGMITIVMFFIYLITYIWAQRIIINAINNQEF